MTKNKKPVVKMGLHIQKSSKGFSVHVHSTNGNKLAVMSGYNTKQSAVKALAALHSVISDAWLHGAKYLYTDHTKKKPA